MPGVPDVYQGCELTGRALVDPDNRRPVDFAARQELLAALDYAEPGGRQLDGLDAAKLLVTSRALRLRRDHRDWFAGGYQPLAGTGAAAAHVIAFCRGNQAVTVATRLPAGLQRAGGWRDTTLPLPAGLWIDVLTGRDTWCRPASGRTPAADSCCSPISLRASPWHCWCPPLNLRSL